MSQTALPTIDDLIGKTEADKIRDQVASGEAKVLVFKGSQPISAEDFLNLPKAKVDDAACQCPKCKSIKIAVEAGLDPELAPTVVKKIGKIWWDRANQVTEERLVGTGMQQIVDAAPISHAALEKISAEGHGHPLAILADTALHEMKKVAPKLFT